MNDPQNKVRSTTEKFILDWLKKDPERTLRRLRKAFDVRQEDLASDLGISYSTVSLHENGHNRPHKLIMKEYARFYTEQSFLKDVDIFQLLR